MSSKPESKSKKKKKAAKSETKPLLSVKKAESKRDSADSKADLKSVDSEPAGEMEAPEEKGLAVGFKRSVQKANKWLQRLGIGGVVLAAIGLLILLRSYFTFTLDSFGIGLTACGVLLIALPGVIMQTILAPDDSKQIFRFIHINDRMKEDLAQLDILLEPTRVELPAAAKKALQTKLKQATSDDKKQTGDKDSETVKQVEADLAAGMSVPAVIRKHARPRVFVIDFNGDPLASDTKFLRDFVTLCIAVLSPKFDRVVIKLTSPGGLVSSYGHAANQLVRLRRAGIHTTVSTDVVAASGGYMMACVADKIVASPFAFVGSIGVIMGIPNISKVLKKNEVDYLMFTAGRFKRTVTMLTDVTQEQKDKLQEELVAIHVAFKDHIQQYRPQLDIERYATGEAWLATEALEKGLVDELLTSDELILSYLRTHEVIEVRRKKKKTSTLRTIVDLLGLSASRALQWLQSPSSSLLSLAQSAGTMPQAALSNAALAPHFAGSAVVTSNAHSYALQSDCATRFAASAEHLPQLSAAALYSGVAAESAADRRFAHDDDADG